MSEKKVITLRVEDKNRHETVDFILDSNTIRFKNGASEEIDRNEAVKNFFAYTDSHKDKYNFVVPWQVGSELRIFIYRIRHLHKENEVYQKNIDKVEEELENIEFVECTADKYLEEEIRLLFEFLKANYDFYYEDGEKLKLNSLKTDDARILLTALQEDYSIVTHNVKDFAPVFAFEKAIWNPVSDKIYRLTETSEIILKEDKSLQNRISSIISKLESDLSVEDEQDLLRKLKPKNL